MLVTPRARVINSLVFDDCGIFSSKFPLATLPTAVVRSEMGLASLEARNNDNIPAKTAKIDVMIT